ncbi:NAD-dependent epimerase/dehydratase family protein [Pararobbsia silviterrae]|uniref:NAD-dependent epimerase/dehydratase family protein n=1 Tax=Pararobbsia silviterrae TaxID=1792498 RepID=A0A494X6N6_9BURK|nr:NAD-dependent epimerase/dehydratase family protein [Pararobbsia silviterrae]RKP43659.1 NAD-dependent epimerase/dehydratase family protein [Pararobbsia silviterrae]
MNAPNLIVPLDIAQPHSHPPRRIFLTGGSGYIGRNVIRHFTALGVEIIALVRSEAARNTVTTLGAEPFDGDLLTAALHEGMASCDALIHAAADTDHGLGGQAQRRANVDGTRRVLDAARNAGIAQAIHLSTESVLLDGKPLINASERHPYPARFAGTYSSTKAEAERVALSFNTSDFPVVVLRPRFVWGRDDSTALPQIVAAATAGKFAWIDGGRYRTSTTHIANLVHGVELALLHGVGGNVYFITDGEPVMFRNFIARLLATQGIAEPTREVPGWLVRSIATVGESLGRLSRGAIKPIVTRQSLATASVEVTLDISKARAQLRYTPVVAIEDGLAELVRARTLVEPH